MLFVWTARVSWVRLDLGTSSGSSLVRLCGGFVSIRQFVSWRWFCNSEVNEFCVFVVVLHPFLLVCVPFRVFCISLPALVQINHVSHVLSDRRSRMQWAAERHSSHYLQEVQTGSCGLIGAGTLLQWFIVHSLPVNDDLSTSMWTKCSGGEDCCGRKCCSPGCLGVIFLLLLMRPPPGFCCMNVTDFTVDVIIEHQTSPAPRVGRCSASRRHRGSCCAKCASVTQNNKEKDKGGAVGGADGCVCAGGGWRPSGGSSRRSSIKQ